MLFERPAANHAVGQPSGTKSGLAADGLDIVATLEAGGWGDREAECRWSSRRRWTSTSASGIGYAKAFAVSWSAMSKSVLLSTSCASRPVITIKC